MWLDYLQNRCIRDSIVWNPVIVPVFFVRKRKCIIANLSFRAVLVDVKSGWFLSFRLLFYSESGDCSFLEYFSLGMEVFHLYSVHPRYTFRCATSTDPAKGNRFQVLAKGASSVPGRPRWTCRLILILTLPNRWPNHWKLTFLS